MSSPMISEGPGNASEVPLSLPPSSRISNGEFGSAYYGPVPTAPPGSAGSSRDIRYPQNWQRLPSTSLLEPRSPSNNTQKIRPIPMPQKGGNETPVDVPKTQKRNGNGQNPSPSTKSEGESNADKATEEATGIPHYTVAEPNVATGGQPTLDGIKWLKERGFRAVLNLLPDSEADPAEASMVRELELDYISLPITDGTITRETADMFDRLVDDPQYRPIFVHDSTGARTGALWYLHRIRVDKTPDDRARIQAGRIGLKDSDTELWLAIQRVLAGGN
jgi:protein tyrosine phosphatase (PTP) superfamily phosphohydrolase (DUF442 family)